WMFAEAFAQLLAQSHRSQASALVAETDSRGFSGRRRIAGPHWRCLSRSARRTIDGGSGKAGAGDLPDAKRRTCAAALAAQDFRRQYRGSMGFNPFASICAK